MLAAGSALADTIMALHDHPRRVRRRKSARASMTFLRVVLAPLMLLGAVAAAVLVIATLWYFFGSNHVVKIDAVTDRVRPKMPIEHTAQYHLVLHGHTFSGDQVVADADMGKKDPVHLRTFGRWPFVYAQSLAGQDSGLWHLLGVWLIAPWLIALGLLAAYFAIVRPWREKQLYLTGLAVQGEIVRKMQAFRGKSLSLSALYEFTTATNETQIASQTLSPSQFKEIKAGQPVIVLYDPSTPEKSLLYDYRGYELVR